MRYFGETIFPLAMSPKLARCPVTRCIRRSFFLFRQMSWKRLFPPKSTAAVTTPSTISKSEHSLAATFRSSISADEPWCACAPPPCPISMVSSSFDQVFHACKSPLLEFAKFRNLARAFAFLSHHVRNEHMTSSRRQQELRFRNKRRRSNRNTSLVKT